MVDINNNFGNENIKTDPLFDVFCDPENPKIIRCADVIKAQQNIKGGVVQTSLIKSRLCEELGIELYFKNEFQQFTSSFKDRGALNALLNLTEEQKRQGVITTSAGNHSQAMAYQAAKLNIPVTVVMPEITPRIKVNRCRKMKAKVLLHGKHFDEAREYAMNICNKENLVYINGYDHPDIIAGQGTIGLEILNEVPDVDYILVSVGGGGMIAGISAAVKEIQPKCQIIGIESSMCPAWTTAMTAGKPTACELTKKESSQSITDGLNVVQVGVNAFATTSYHHIDKMICVDEDYISLAILKLIETEKFVIEGAGAAGLAAILSGSLPELKGKKVACILCGGNIDTTRLTKVINRGLVMDGRIIKFKCVINNNCSGISSLLQYINKLDINVRDIVHEQMDLVGTAFKASVTITADTLHRSHSLEVKENLLQQYKDDLTWVQLR